MKPKPPAPKRGVYVFAAVDTRQKPPEVKFVELTRRAVRDKIEWSKEADTLRIRRARIFLYES